MEALVAAGMVGGVVVKGATSTLVKSFVEKVVVPYFAGRGAKKEMVAHVKAYLRWLDQRTKYIPTIAIQGGTFALEEVYEPLELKSVDGQDLFQVASFPSEIFEKDRCIAIVDSAGMGKSTITKFILRKSLEELNKIPILVELRRLKPGVSITDLICADVVKKSSSSPAAEHLLAALRDGNFIVFLDGYDEIQDEIKSSVSEEILKISSDFRYCNFVLTSRREVALSGFPEFFWYHISRLSPEKSLSLLRRYDKNRGVADRLWTKASVIEEISDFLETPLLLTLLYKAFDYKSVVPIKRATFYRQVFDALYQDHDLSKEGFFERRKKSSLDLDDFHKVMRRVGLDCVRRGEVQFSSEQFHDLLVSAVASAGVVADPAKLKADLVSAVPLFVKDGAEYRWSHKSFADYFAATCVWMDLGSDRKKIVTAMFNSARCEKYSAVLKIICELDEGLIVDNCIGPYLEKIIPGSLLDSDEDNFYFSFVEHVAKVYMVSGEYSVDDPETCFRRLDKEVIGKSDLVGYASWRITWGLSDGKIMYVAVNDEFSRLNVIAEILGLPNSPRARRVPVALYEKLGGTVCLNDYLKAAPQEERADALIAIRQGMRPARIPLLPVAKKILADAMTRQKKPEIASEW